MCVCVTYVILMATNRVSEYIHLWLYVIYVYIHIICMYYVCDLIAQWISKPFQTILFAFKQLIGFNLLTHHDPKQFQRFFPLVALLACADCLGIFFSSTRALSGGGACLDSSISSHMLNPWTLNMFEHLWTLSLLMKQLWPVLRWTASHSVRRGAAL